MKRYNLVIFNTEEVLVNNVSEQEAESIMQVSKEILMRVELDEEPENTFAFALNGGGEIPDQNGMTLRDYFAAQAISGQAWEGISTTAPEAAKRAYFLADAMLKERSKE